MQEIPNSSDDSQRGSSRNQAPLQPNVGRPNVDDGGQTIPDPCGGDTVYPSDKLGIEYISWLAERYDDPKRDFDLNLKHFNNE